MFRKWDEWIHYFRGDTIQVIKISMYTYRMWDQNGVEITEVGLWNNQLDRLVNFWHVNSESIQLNRGHVRHELPGVVSSNGMILKWIMVYKEERGDDRFGIKILRHIWMYKWTHCSWESSIGYVVIQKLSVRIS